MTPEEARHYVGAGSAEEQGQAVEIHLDLLQGFGMTPQTSVLEIGAGCLGLAHKLVEYLDRDGYTGIEPNEAVMATAPPLDTTKNPLLLARRDFDPTTSGRTFDIVFAHSVLTHAARWQLHFFLRRIRPHLRPGGHILASLRWGKDTHAESWTYPKAVWFSPEAVANAAQREGFSVQPRPDIREKCEARLPRMFHDWAVFRPVEVT